MSDHLIAEANRHAKALPKMTLPTTKPNDLDLAWYRRSSASFRSCNNSHSRLYQARSNCYKTEMRRWSARTPRCGLPLRSPKSLPGKTARRAALKYANCCARTPRCGKTRSGWIGSQKIAASL